MANNYFYSWRWSDHCLKENTRQKWSSCRLNKNTSMSLNSSSMICWRMLHAKEKRYLLHYITRGKCMPFIWHKEFVFLVLDIQYPIIYKWDLKNMCEVMATIRNHLIHKIEYRPKGDKDRKTRHKSHIKRSLFRLELVVLYPKMMKKITQLF